MVRIIIPQIFKQIMIGGMDRYFQLCRCFRDEDLRADRQPEFTQIDIEMSFVTQDMIIELSNGLIRTVWSEVLGKDVGEIPTISYAEAIDRFGVDNPDLRFDMELFTANWVGTDFGVISGALDRGGIARGFVVKGAATVSNSLFKTHKKKGDGAWLAFVKKYRLGGLLYGKLRTVNGVDRSEKLVKISQYNSNVEEGDLVLVGAGPKGA